MSNYVLRMSGISKKYGNFHALQDVNIEIKQGQIYGLIGQNGAGKTTLMRAITGLISVSKGEIELFGVKGERNLQTQRHRIGQSIEMPALYPNFTATEVLEVQRIIGNRADKKEIKNVLEKVELADTGKKKIKNFSLGMKQRLALAMALITNPEFVILDEPVNGLDPQGIILVRELIKDLAQNKGITLMVSSHLLDELSQIATHYGIIDNGKLIRQLSAAELTRESRNSIGLIVDNIEKTIALLKKEFNIVDIEKISENELRIYEKIDQTRNISRILVQHNIGVNSISVSGQRLEEYFVNLTKDNI